MLGHEQARLSGSDGDQPGPGIRYAPHRRERIRVDSGPPFVMV